MQDRAAPRRAWCLLLLLPAVLSGGCTYLAYEGYEKYIATPPVANPLSCKLLKASAYAYQVNATGPIADPALSKLLDESGEGYGVISGGAGQSDTDRDAAYVWHSKDEVIIAFRGTLPYPAGSGDQSAQQLAIQDWLNDADYASDADPDLGTVHRGFRDAFYNLWPGILKQIKTWQTAGTLGPEVKVYVTGHSKGGALAMLAALKLKADKLLAVTEADTFGAPRVGGADFAAKYAAAGIPDNRYENDGDVVPHVPLSQAELALLPLLQHVMAFSGNQPGNYVSVGQLRFIKDDGSLISPLDVDEEADLDATRIEDFGPLFLGSPHDAMDTIVAAHSLGDLSATDPSRYFQAVCGTAPAPH